MSKPIPTVLPNGKPASFDTSPGISLIPEPAGQVLIGEIFFKEGIPVLDPAGIAVRVAYHVDSNRCRIVERGSWIYVSWPVEDDTDMYHPTGTRRLWVQTPMDNVKFFQSFGDCPTWLR